MEGELQRICFPHEQSSGTTCLGQERWQGAERDLQGKRRRGVQEARVARSSQWKKVLSEQLVE